MAVAALDIFQQVLHAGDEVLAIGRQRGAQDFRIGEEEVRGREGVRHLADIEVRLFARVLVDAFGELHAVGHPFAGEQVGLLHQVEDQVFVPVGIAEALVRAAGRGDGRHVLAEQAARQIGGEADIAFPQRGLRLDDLRRIAHVARGDIHQRPADALKVMQSVARVGGRIVGTHELASGLLPEVRRMHEVDREAAEIGHHIFARIRVGFTGGGLFGSGGRLRFRGPGGRSGSLCRRGFPALLLRPGGFFLRGHGFLFAGRVLEAHKRFPGGSLRVSGASAALRARPVDQQFIVTSVYYTLDHVRPMTRKQGQETGAKA